MRTLIAPPTASPLNAADIRHLIADGRRLIASSQLEAAAVRLSLTELWQRTDDPIWISDTRSGLSAQAVAYGVIDPEDRDVLLHFLPMRDAAAHGNAGVIDAGVLQEVGRFAERALDEMEQQQ